MKQITLQSGNLQVPNLILGCMRIRELEEKEAEKLIRTALEQGICYFDHADIYGGNHQCEEHFARSLSMTPALREKMILQTKCGIASGYFDFSKNHILEAVDESLHALQTDYIDLLLLHRPDTLMEPEEVAEAFTILETKGKVKGFGVSNMNPMQLELLQNYLPQKLIVNQLQFSLAHTPMIDSGLTVNMHTEQSLNKEGSILEYCRLKGITIQAWSPFQKGFFEGPFLGDFETYPELNKTAEAIAEKYHVTPTAVAVGWITRHPANMQVILGTTKVSRLLECAKGSDLPLTRAEWYELYRAAGNILP